MMSNWLSDGIRIQARIQNSIFIREYAQYLSANMNICSNFGGSFRYLTQSIRKLQAFTHNTGENEAAGSPLWDLLWQLS